MAVMLSNDTARRMLEFIGGQRPEKLGGNPAAPSRRNASTRRTYLPPWTIRYDVAAVSWIVFVPSHAARILQFGFDTTLNKVTTALLDDFLVSNVAVTDMDDWRKVTGTGTTVYASLSAGVITVSTDIPADTEDAMALAEIDNDTRLVKQLVRSHIILFSGTEAGDAANNPVLADGACRQCPRRNNGGVTDGTDGGVTDNPTDATHPGAGGTHPGGTTTDGGVVSGDTLHPDTCPPCLYGKTLPTTP